MQGVLRTHLESVPLSRPLTSKMPARMASLPAGIVNRWPHASDKLLGGSASSLRALPIDHDVTVVGIRGGAVAAEGALNSFVRRRVAVCHEHHNHPDDRGTSRLSPYLHFGHPSSHQVFEKVMS